VVLSRHQKAQSMLDSATTEKATLRFLMLFGLAWAGASIAYIPFLTLLLPVRVSTLAGPVLGVTWMAYIAFGGAVAASIGHIGFGYLSDITNNRRGWIWAGLIFSCIFLVAVPLATNLMGLISLIVLWQLSLNMMLAPLTAWAGDCVPNSRKGFLGGLMAFAPGIGAIMGTAVTIPGVALPDTRLLMISATVAVFILPILIFGRRRFYPDEQPERPMHDTSTAAHQATPWRSAMRRMWLSRLALQIAEAALFAYLYFWFRSIDPAMNDNRTASVFSIILFISAPLALITGRWADRRGRPLLPLVMCAAVSAFGLLCMGLAPNLLLAIGAYAVFGFASSVFLALHSAQTLRVLPRPERRGRDLGIFNLTNTLPSIIMPWIVLSLVPHFGFSGLFFLLAMLALGSGLILLPLTRHP
jgi:MFS family permease